MKTLTEKQRQWLWFFGLGAGGLIACYLLACAVRLLFKFN